MSRSLGRYVYLELPSETVPESGVVEGLEKLRKAEAIGRVFVVEIRTQFSQVGAKN